MRDLLVSWHIDDIEKAQYVLVDQVLHDDYFPQDPLGVDLKAQRSEFEHKFTYNIFYVGKLFDGVLLIRLSILNRNDGAISSFSNKLDGLVFYGQFERYITEFRAGKSR